MGGNAGHALSTAKNIAPCMMTRTEPPKLGRSGGRNRTAGTQLIREDWLPTEPPKAAEQLRDFLAEVVAHVRQGRLNTKIANAVAYAGATLLRAIEASSLEARLAALEATMPQNIENRASNQNELFNQTPS